MRQEQKEAASAWPDARGYFGSYGGQFVPETLVPALRELEAMDCDVILVAAPVADEAWRAVADRLRRAAAGSK